MTNLIATAEEMRQQLERTGQSQERTITHARTEDAPWALPAP